MFITQREKKLNYSKKIDWKPAFFFIFINKSMKLFYYWSIRKLSVIRCRVHCDFGASQAVIRFLWVFECLWFTRKIHRKIYHGLWILWKLENNQLNCLTIASDEKHFGVLLRKWRGKKWRKSHHVPHSIVSKLKLKRALWATI